MSLLTTFNEYYNVSVDEFVAGELSLLLFDAKTSVSTSVFLFRCCIKSAIKITQNADY